MRFAKALLILSLALNGVPAGLRAGETTNLAQINCVEGECGLLLGNQHDQPALADLIGNIIDIVPRVEAEPADRSALAGEGINWGGKTVSLAGYLRSCAKIATGFRKFLLPPCFPGVDASLKIDDTKYKIQMDAHRRELMSDYLLRNTGDGDPELPRPSLIVLHWTGSNSVKSAFQEFNPDEIRVEPGRPSRVLVAGKANYSCHFEVDRDGTIYQLMPDHLKARHIIGLNQDALCVENVGGVDGKEDLTPAQVDANVALIKYLSHRHPSIQAVIGHLESGALIGSYLYGEKLPDYIDHKPDPGPAFLSQVRDGLHRACEGAVR